MKNCIKNIVAKSILYSMAKKVAEIYYDTQAKVYLNIVKHKNNDGVIKVGFIVHEPQSWDKLKPVFDKMSCEEDFETSLIIVPSYDTNLALSNEYGYEKEYFIGQYPNCILAYEDKKCIDIKKMRFDFLFYQDPYVQHYPKPLQPQVVSKYSRICYLPYGYTIMQNFSRDLLTINKSFFRYMMYFFAGNKSELSVMKELLHSNGNDIYKLNYMGYPSLEQYIHIDNKKAISTITWTPRWTYDKKYGGSHFLEYKDDYIKLAQNYPMIEFIFRPHPMLMQTMINEGRLSKKEVEDFLEQLASTNIIVDTDSSIDQIIEKTDILITDVSSIIMSFFLTNKPLIYCKCNLEPNDEFKNIEDACYTADNWRDVEYEIANLIAGLDEKKSLRETLIENIKNIEEGASDRIIKYIRNEIYERR